MANNFKSGVHVAEMGIFVHGMLAGLHLIGVAHNARKRNWFDSTAHALAACYDVYAVVKHTDELKEALGASAE